MTARPEHSASAGGRPPTADSGPRRPRVVIVARAAPAQSGVSSFVEALLDDQVLQERFTLTLLNTTRTAERRSGLLSLENASQAVVDAVRTFRAARRADVVHLQAAMWPGLALVRALAICVAGRLAGAGVLCHVHSGEINSGRDEAFRPGPVARLLLRVLSVVDAVLTVSDPGTRVLRRLVPGARVETVDNAVHVRTFVPAALDGVPPRVLFVGALSYRKGVIDLVAALQALRARGIDDEGWALEIVGGAAEVGEQEADAIRAVVREAGWGDSLVGVQRGADLHRHLRAADVFVLPSHAEGQPMAIIEAMASGLPVVATRVGAVPDMLRDGVDGLLVEPRDVPALAAALGRVIDSADLRQRMGASARARAEERYDVDRLREQLTGHYRVAARRRSTGGRLAGARRRLTAGRRSRRTS